MTTIKLIQALFLFFTLIILWTVPAILEVIVNSPWFLVGAGILTWLVLPLRWIPRMVEESNE